MVRDGSGPRGWRGRSKWAARGRLAAAGLLAAGIILGAAGCSSPNAAYCDGETPCTDPARPYCLVDRMQCSAAPAGEPCGEGGACADPEHPVCFHGVCVGCAGDADCAAAAPVCETSTLTCGPCAEGEDEVCSRFEGEAPMCVAGGCRACAGATDCPHESPVCDPDALSCRGCQADGECQSLLCQEGLGTCADPLEVLYVEVDGDDGGGCTQDDPCRTIARAVELATGERSWVHLGAGVYDQPLVIDRDVTVTGDGAELVASAGGTAIVTVTGGASVTFESVVVRDAPAGTQPGEAYGVRCEGGSALRLVAVAVTGNASDGVHSFGCRLELEDCQVDANGGEGVAIEGGSAEVTGSRVAANGSHGIFAFGTSSSVELRGSEVRDNLEQGVFIGAGASGAVLDSEVRDNQERGITISGGAELVVARSLVVHNGRGGVYATDADVEVVNNFIVDNGNLEDGLGGIRLYSGVLTALVEHNTIVRNRSSTGLGAGGITCAVDRALRNNLLAENRDGAEPGAQTSGCSHTYTLGYPVAPPGAGNLDDQPVFAGADDYHLQAGSPGVGAATAGTVEDDIDGDPRPDSGRDIGADEVTP